MAFPTTITTYDDYTVGTGWSRPFISSAGNVYVILASTDDSTKLGIFKATDPETSFSLQQEIQVTNSITTFSAEQEGDTLHIVTGDSSTLASVYYHEFDMSTDTLDTTNEEVSADFDILGQSLERVFITVRSDGDLIVLYNGAAQVILPDGGTYQRVYYARKESGTWTADIDICDSTPINYIAHNVILGSSDRAHFLFTDADENIYLRTLTSSNSLDSFPTGFSGANNGNRYFSGASYDDSGTQRVRLLKTSDVTSIDCINFDSADTPTTSEETDITGASDIGLDYFAFSLVAHGTTLYCIYCDSVADVYYLTNEDGGGWSSPTLLFSGAYIVHCNVYTRSSSDVIGIVFFDTSSNQAYTELELGGATIASAAFSSTATAAVTWNASSFATSSLASTATATATFNGQAIAAAAAADFSMGATATLTMQAASIAGSAYDADATARAAFAAERQTIQRFDGWRIKKQQQDEFELQEEEDLLFFSTALLAYLEQNK